ncbi:coadhesin [Biomphalaria glabrata]|nr:coadhesin [Biomphalaria glabrata]
MFGLNFFSLVLQTIFITEQTVLATREPEPKGVSNFGKRFVVALPGQKGQRRLFANFVLFTLEYGNFNVTLSTKWSNQSTDYNYTITNGRPARARLSHEFVGFEKYGQKGNSYALQANYRFSCQVFLENKAHFNISAHFLALPMEGWGQWYLLLTTNSNPSVQVVNGLSEQRVQILAPIREKSVLRHFGYQREAYGFYLLSEESWSLQLCTEKVWASSLSGYKVQGTSPYGVITGSCFDEEVYLASDPGCRPDINLDMLFPISKYATKFIVTKPVKFEGHLKIVVAKAKTQISVDGETINKNFTSQRDLELISFEKENMVGPHFIMSTGAITVAFFVITTCKSNSYVEIASTIFVPTGLYMDNYYWTIYKEETMKNYLLMIARIWDLDFVYINGYHIESSPASNICTLLNYTSYYNEKTTIRKAGLWLGAEYQLLLDGYHQLYNKNGLRLSVFLYGRRDRATYIYPAGFVVPPESLSTCEDTTSGQTEGDLIDNDCDGYIDEEHRDHEDDDGDDRIDEDKGKSPLVNGHWAEWKGWQCESTFATTAHRSRYCDDPPPYNGGMPCSGSDVDVLSNINCTNIESAVIGELFSTTISRSGLRLLVS